MALLAAGVASTPIEILNYEAAEAGHGQVMSGTPGEAVMGEFYWKASCHFVIIVNIMTFLFRLPRVMTSSWCTLLTWLAMFPPGPTCLSAPS